MVMLSTVSTIDCSVVLVGVWDGLGKVIVIPVIEKQSAEHHYNVRIRSLSHRFFAVYSAMREWIGWIWIADSFSRRMLAARLQFQRFAMCYV